MKSLWFALFLACASTTAVQAETAANTTPINLSGPRLGFTLLSNGFIDEVKADHGVELQPLLTQFGWQHEKRFFTMSDGATGVSEIILLLGGVEQGQFIPSASWLIGMRSGSGVEFGMGPNLSPSGSAIVLAFGVTVQSEEINFPINFAAAMSDSGPRFSILFGFNIREYY